MKVTVKISLVFLALFACLNLLSVNTNAQPAVSAASSVLMEQSHKKVLLDNNAHKRMPMASTTKIMTALVALEQCDDLAKEIQIPQEAVGIEGSSVYLKAGECLTMEQLLYAVLLESANDAATAVALEIGGSIPEFADMMNETATRLGLNDTHFTNPHGLDEKEHYTTAYDLAILTCYALNNELFSKIVSTYKTMIPLNGSEGTRVLINHNRMLKSYEGAIGVKTGYTRRCGRCLVSAAQRNGITMVAVTLSAPDDWRDHTAMLDYGFSLYENLLLAEAGSYVFEIPILGSTQSAVRVSNHESCSCVLPKNHGEITSFTEINRYLCAPIHSGNAIGNLIFYCDGDEIARVPLIADESIEAVPNKKSAADYIKDLLRIS